MSIINATLEWEGVWKLNEENIQSDIPDSKGIYMILCGSPSKKDTNKWDVSSYEIIYIGESDEVRSRIVGHEKWSCWKEHCNRNLLLKVALYESNTSNRQKVECCLINHTKPICNDECKDNYPHNSDTVKINNIGSHRPLEDKYTC